MSDKQCKACGDDLFITKFDYHHYCAEEELDRLRAELEAARAEIHRKNTHLLCSFCSFEVRIDDEKEALKAIQKHVAEECEYHPITKLLKDVKAELTAALHETDNKIDEAALKWLKERGE